MMMSDFIQMVGMARGMFSNIAGGQLLFISG